MILWALAFLIFLGALGAIFYYAVAVILLHDGCPPGESGDRRQTAAALEEIVRVLGGRHRFVTVSEMF